MLFATVTVAFTAAPKVNTLQTDNGFVLPLIFSLSGGTFRKSVAPLIPICYYSKRFCNEAQCDRSHHTFQCAGRFNIGCLSACRRLLVGLSVTRYRDRCKRI